MTRSLLFPRPRLCLLFFALAACFNNVENAFSEYLGQKCTPKESRIKFNGKTIRNIDIQIKDIFEKPINSIYSTANKLKINTKEQVVRQELLLKEGDKYYEFLVAESERVLRSLRYLRNINIEPIPVSDKNDKQVDLLVEVQDTWTLIPQVSFSSGDGRDKYSVGLAESDLFGYGNRVEVLYEEDEDRESIQSVFDSRRVLGSNNQLVLGYFDRNDGQRQLFSFSRPFRSLVDKNAWGSRIDDSDTIGRLFENGDESYIYRQEKIDLEFRYTFARGNPEESVRRYSFGYKYQEKDFAQADLDDYDDLDLDPEEVSNDPALLASDRRFSGLLLSYQDITPEFVSMAYIDRFNRIQDYNLGVNFSINAFISPEAFGSLDDSVLLNANRSSGIRFNKQSFLRGEIGVATRYEDSSFEDTLARAELKYYSAFEPWFIKDFYVGRHTLAASFFIDYGDDLDLDRQLLIGGDNALRGYKARTFAGDKRLVLSLEDRMHFVENAFDLISVGGVVFLDVGGASYDTLGNLITDEMYSDIGIGLRFAFPRSSGERVLRIDLAFPLRDGPDGSAEFEPRILFSGGQLFGSRLRSEVVGADRASVDIGFDN